MALVDRIATCTIATPTLGTHTYDAAYSGGGFTLASTGSLLQQVVIVAPGAPTALTVTSANAAASVAFGPPEDLGGAQVISYTATCTDGLDSVSNTGLASPIVVTGLSNGTQYTCTVFATNLAGDGPAVMPGVPVLPATVPDSPTNAAAAAGAAQATVTFSPSTGDGACRSPATPPSATTAPPARMRPGRRHPSS